MKVSVRTKDKIQNKIYTRCLTLPQNLTNTSVSTLRHPRPISHRKEEVEVGTRDRTFSCPPTQCGPRHVTPSTLCSQRSPARGLNSVPLGSRGTPGTVTKGDWVYPIGPRPTVSQTRSVVAPTDLRSPGRLKHRGTHVYDRFKSGVGVRGDRYGKGNRTDVQECRGHLH